MLPALIDTRALAETVAAAFVTGVGVSVVFSLAIYGAARFGEAGRQGRVAAALAYGGLATVAGLVFVAAIAAGIFVMTAK